MQAKTYIRSRARKLRSAGRGVNETAKELNVSKGSVSVWMRGVSLSGKQLRRLRQELAGAAKGRLVLR